MGRVDVMQNKDFSDRIAGRFDFDNLIFRRLIAGKLERNYLKTAVGTAYLTTPIEMKGDTAELRFSFYEMANTGGRPIFGAADYANNKAVMIFAFIATSGVSFLQVYVLGPTGTPGTVNYQQNRIYLGDLGTLDPATSHTLVAKINFNTTLVVEATVDGVTNIPELYGSTVQTPFTYTAASLSFGDAPWIRPIPVANTAAACSFAQMRDGAGNVIFHFDFLGDNLNEILTEKDRLRLLKNTGVEIVSDPITI